MQKVKTALGGKKRVNALRQQTDVYKSGSALKNVLLWGVNHTLSELAHTPPKPLLMPTDFGAYAKIRVESCGMNNEFLPDNYKVKEYCPLVFRDLRARFNMDPENFLSAICDCNVDGEDPSEPLILKTIEGERLSMFLDQLKKYHYEVVERPQASLLPQYLAAYRLTLNDKDVYVIIMRSVCSCQLPTAQRYILKGSTAARRASDKEKQKPSPILKDNDFLEHGRVLSIGMEAKSKLMSAVNRDVDFLCRKKLMDYGLLVSIHSLDDTGDGAPLSMEGESYSNCRWAFIGANEERKEIYFCGIVNALTKYNGKKMAAHYAKSARQGHLHAENITTVNPEQYAKRFMDMLDRILT